VSDDYVTGKTLCCCFSISQETSFVKKDIAHNRVLCGKICTAAPGIANGTIVFLR
jgi:hypothetical protein